MGVHTRALLWERGKGVNCESRQKKTVVKFSNIRITFILGGGGKLRFRGSSREMQSSSEMSSLDSFQSSVYLLCSALIL